MIEKKSQQIKIIIVYVLPAICKFSHSAVEVLSHRAGSFSGCDSIDDSILYGVEFVF